MFKTDRHRRSQTATQIHASINTACSLQTQTQAHRHASQTQTEHVPMYQGADTHKHAILYQGVDEGFTQHVEHVELRERHIVVVERAQKQLPKNKLARGTAKRHIHVGISSPETAGIECSGFRV